MVFLRKNVDVFVESAYEASEVDLDFICYYLNVNPTVVLKKQPPRCSSKEHAKAVKEEVNKFKHVGAIKEVFYLEWLANTVVVKKKSRKWIVCVDFTDLNKAWSKDPFTIPRIAQLVDTTIGHSRMSFLEAFQRYHQIPLALADPEKTTLLTLTGNYYYRVMPFGLKNARSTFQWMMIKMF